MPAARTVVLPNAIDTAQAVPRTPEARAAVRQALGVSEETTLLVNVGRLDSQKGQDVLLDALARAPMWQHNIDFGHGTGHGVGYFLNVHEGPQTISRSLPDASMAMQEGMITSVEPGIYRPGQWGVRIENLVLNVPAQKNGFGDFLRFETLTLCPIDTRCIEHSLLSRQEVDWLNHYHTEVQRRLLPLVTGAARDWLLHATQAI